MISQVMPAAGVEPALPLGERDFKSRASANSAMPAGTLYGSYTGSFIVFGGGLLTAALYAFSDIRGPSGTRTQDRPVMSREL